MSDINDSVIVEYFDEEKIADAIRAVMRNSLYALAQGRVPADVEFEVDRKTKEISAKVAMVHRRLPEGQTSLALQPLEDAILAERGSDTPFDEGLEALDGLFEEMTEMPEVEDEAVLVEEED